MDATVGGALLRRSPVVLRRPAGDAGLIPMKPRTERLKMGTGFEDEGQLRYYGASMSVRCGLKKEEKRRKKLVKGLEKDLSALCTIGVDKGEGLADQAKGQIISEAAEVLLAQLTKMRTEAKEMKRRRKQEKAAVKAAKMEDNDGSSSESSDSECETVVKMNSLRSTTKPDPVFQTENVIEEAKSNLALFPEPQCCSSSSNGVVAVKNKPMDDIGNKIEVCMGGKCKKSGAMELMAEFEKRVGNEGGAVVGCKCMGKCRDGPNVRVVNRREDDDDQGGLFKKGPLCIGVGLEDVGSIVAKLLGEGENVGYLAAS